MNFAGLPHILIEMEIISIWKIHTYVKQDQNDNMS